MEESAKRHCEESAANQIQALEQLEERHKVDREGAMDNQAQVLSLLEERTLEDREETRSQLTRMWEETMYLIFQQGEEKKKREQT